MTQCAFCKKRESSSHLCSKKYCYEYIFREFFISIWLKFEPVTILDFYNYCLREIESRNLFTDSPDPRDLLEEVLNVFVEEYRCFG